MKLSENNYRQVGRVSGELSSDRHYFKVDMVNAILGDISDELYTITNKIENIGRLANQIGCTDTDGDVEKLVNSLDYVLNIDVNQTWQHLLQSIEEQSKNN